jgi:hypothetical protein
MLVKLGREKNPLKHIIYNLLISEKNFGPQPDIFANSTSIVLSK